VSKTTARILGKHAKSHHNVQVSDDLLDNDYCARLATDMCDIRATDKVMHESMNMSAKLSMADVPGIEASLQ
jgi:hypothetical protein